MKKIRFVQLEPEAVLSDMDFQLMNAEERGVFWTLILYLYCNNGKCTLDIPAMKNLCACENFEKVWKKISKKFQIRNGLIKHKRVTRELQKAQKLRRAALTAAKARWQIASSDDAIASKSQSNVKETKRNVIEEKVSEQSRIRNTNSEISPSFSPSSFRPRGLHFYEALTKIIRPLNQSDRTCFRNITNWLIGRCESGRFDNRVFERVLDYAREAAKGGRNPAAVFTTILKKELGYKNG